MSRGSHRPGRIAAALALGLVCGPGCSTAPVTPDPPPAVVIETSETIPTTVLLAGNDAPTEPSGPLSLDDLLALARRQSPDLAAAAGRVAEAQGQFVQAGLYPNPTVGYTGNQINDGPGTAGQQGVFIAQEIVTGGKLAVAREAAAHGITAADWQAASRWYETAA